MTGRDVPEAWVGGRRGRKWPTDHPTAAASASARMDASCRLVVIMNLAFLEERHPEGYPRVPVYGGFGDRPFPNIPRISQREYGNRVGLFRLFFLLSEYGVPSAVAVDAFTARALPYVVEHCLDSGCEVITRGLSESRPLTSAMTAREQQDYIAQATSDLRRVVGYQPAGWMSPMLSGTDVTAEQLVEAGYTYSCDWPNGDLPGRFTRSGLGSLPIYIDLDDEYAFYGQGLTPAQYEERFRRALEQYRVEQAAGSLLVLSIRPWIMGQPFRVASLRRMLEYAMAADHVRAIRPHEVFGDQSEQPVHGPDRDAR